MSRITAHHNGESYEVRIDDSVVRSGYVHPISLAKDYGVTPLYHAGKSITEDHERNRLTQAAIGQVLQTL